MVTEIQNLLTTSELAEKFRVTTDTILRWRKARRIPFIKISGKNVYRFDFAAVMAALNNTAGTSMLPKGSGHE